MIERDVRIAPILAFALLAGATPVSPQAPTPVAWEPSARALRDARLVTEDALARLIEGATPEKRDAAVKAMESLLAAADAFKANADTITSRLNAPGMPPAANDRHAAFVASHKTRRAQLASVLPGLRSSTPLEPARDALAIFAEASGGPPRDAASSIAVRHVRRIAPRDANANFSDIDDVRLDETMSPARDLAAPPKAIAEAAARIPARFR